MDHLRDQSAVAKPLYDMVASTTKQNIKSLEWSPDGHIAFEKLKALINNCPKLYFIDYNLPVILYTDSSDYAHGAYLCQIRALPDGTSIEEPIRLLGDTFQVRSHASRVHNRKGSLCDIIGSPEA